MCGRVRLSSDYSEIKIRLKFDLDAPAPNFEPDWNKPPTAPMLVAIRSVDGKRVPKMMKWGLIPRWAKDEKIQYSTHNARSEEFATKPAFRDAWKRGQRCLVVTDGYYEWKVLDPKGKKKQPYAIAMADDREMVMAGLWETWKSPTSGEEILTCTIMTCAANKNMAEIHDRMPVILDEADWPKWLGEDAATPDELYALLKPCPDEGLKAWPVDKSVGNVRNKGPQLITPVDPSLFGETITLRSHVHVDFKVAMKAIRFWRIGFCLIARKLRTRAAPSRVPRNETIAPSDSSPSCGAGVFFPTVGAPSKK